MEQLDLFSEKRNASGDYIKSTPKAERRFLNIELRAGVDSRTVEGYAAVFNSDSENLGGFIERISPGAFNAVLDNDVVALFNHDPNLILARNKVNMTLSVDERGLKYSFEAPNTTAGNDLLENLRIGNVRTSSFAFSVQKDAWSYSEDRSKPHIRTIEKVDRLYDVSPVTYPAYPDTTVAQRSLFDMEKEHTESTIKVRERKYKQMLIEAALLEL
jgi:HK97 family phage prohead protease